MARTLCFHLQGAQVLSQVREIRSCMLRGAARNIKKNLKIKKNPYFHFELSAIKIILSNNIYPCD